MRTFDLSPLFRSTVGFDRMTRLMESALNADDAAVSYPPYNIEKTGDDDYRIIMAVAGFAPEDIDVTQKEQVLLVAGRQSKDGDQRQYLHRGIAGRAFERRFQLADHIKVTGASLVNGLLHVELKREVPEAAKPRSIRITNATAPAALEQQAA
ncbi:MAG: Hsp20 family protein [Rhodospirillales bacterium]|jgi:molecular chaperone IbpA